MARKPSLRILVVVDPHIPVPPVGYGGTERMAAALCAGLTRKGHRVSLMAGNGSERYSRLICHRPPSSSIVSRMLRKGLFVARSVCERWRCDLVVNFGRVDYLYGILRATSVPVICRFGNPICRAQIEWTLRQRQTRLALVSISEDQRRHVSEMGNWRTIYNAVDTDVLRPVETPSRDYLAFLGLISEEKGAHIALEVAQVAGMPLRLAGKVPNTAEAQAFFRERIAPKLGEQVRYIGEIGDEAKRKLLGNAKALLFPIQAEEAFGLVMAESLSCGTPVIGSDRGPVSEVIRCGRTGFLAGSTTDFVEALTAIDRIDRLECRTDAEARFGLDRMLRDYELLMGDLLWSDGAAKADFEAERASGA